MLRGSCASLVGSNGRWSVAVGEEGQEEVNDGLMQS